MYNSDEQRCQSAAGRNICNDYIYTYTATDCFERHFLPSFISGCVFSGTFGTCALSYEGFVQTNFVSNLTDSEALNLISIKSKCSGIVDQDACRSYGMIHVDPQVMAARLAFDFAAENKDVSQSECLAV